MPYTGNEAYAHTPISVQPRSVTERQVVLPVGEFTVDSRKLMVAGHSRLVLLLEDNPGANLNIQVYTSTVVDGGFKIAEYTWYSDEHSLTAEWRINATWAFFFVSYTKHVTNLTFSYRLSCFAL